MLSGEIHDLALQIVMELCEFGSLADMLSGEQPPRCCVSAKEEVLLTMLDVARGGRDGILIEPIVYVHGICLV